MATESFVQLDSLSVKDRAKELKAVFKSIKSKEEAVKTAAFAVFKNDFRYLIEGGCVVPLIDSIIPKKVCFFYAHPYMSSYHTQFIFHSLSPPLTHFF